MQLPRLSDDKLMWVPRNQLPALLPPEIFPGPIHRMPDALTIDTTCNLLNKYSKQAPSSIVGVQTQEQDFNSFQLLLLYSQRPSDSSDKSNQLPSLFQPNPQRSFGK